MYAILSAVVIGIAMLFLDQTVLPVALPILQQDLHATAAQAHWTVDGYFLFAAVLMLAGGKLADLFGQRRIFLIGILIFGLASLSCGISPNIYCLIISRFIQGIGGALLLPPCIPILLAAFPKDKKGFAVGLQTACSSFFMILGPFLGGLLTETFTWRSIFFLNLPLTLITLFLGWKYIPPSQVKQKKFDLLGVSTYSMGIICWTIAIIQVQSWGWTGGATVVFFALGCVFLSFLYLTDKKAKEPFLHFSLFQHKIFKEASLSVFIVAFQIMMTVFLAVYLQTSFLFSPVEAGLCMTLTTIPVAFGAPIAGALLDAYGFRKSIMIGHTVCILSFIWIVVALPFHHIVGVLAGLCLLSLGWTSVMTPSFSGGIGCIPCDHQGEASGMLGTIRALGANFGVAVTGTVLTDTQLRRVLRDIASNSETASIPVDAIEKLVHADPASQGILESLAPTVHTMVEHYVSAAYQYAFGMVCGINALLGVIGLFGVFLWCKRRNAHSG